MIRLAKSTLTPADKDAVRSVLDREFLGMGPEVRRFEEALAAFFERPVVAVSNGTAALQLALQACGIGPDDEVLVPSLTYVASFQAISATGARPVACDVDSTLHLDPEDAAARISGKTRAIMPVHYGGSVGAQPVGMRPRVAAGSAGQRDRPTGRVAYPARRDGAGRGGLVEWFWRSPARATG